MSIRKMIIGVCVVATLTACKPSQDISAATTFSFADAMSAYFVSEFTSSDETVAFTLRTTNPRYTAQEFSWSFGIGSPSYDSYSLANARVEYAHAVGLTGAGQLIAIMDDGFLPGHDEFSGKSVTSTTGFSLGVADHGTGVASLAAGVADFGEIIGVAPGADLHLGTYDSLASMRVATQEATAMGAIVQNNSWGYGVDISEKNYQLYFGGSAGEGYINALTTFAENGVVVFAASNISRSGHAAMMAALPVLRPGLEDAWIATINAVPVMSGDRVGSATLLSGRCLEAAPWCIAADGTAHVAVSTGVSDYSDDPFTGTSFAAPQVSGAVALLAEAFPELSAQEIRARLLASADNGFFEHTGYVEFAPAVEHGFDEEFGHGFLDLRAALLPIGGTYLPTTAGSVALDGPVVLSGGMAGDALSLRLADHDIVLVDELGGGFSTPANVLTAAPIAVQDPLTSLAEVLSVDLAADTANPFDPNPVFSPFIIGREIEIAYDNTDISLLLPGAQGGESFGVSVSRRIDLVESAIYLGLSLAHEADGFVGMKAISPGADLSADHAAATLEWVFPVEARQEISLAGSVGLAVPNGPLASMSMRQVHYNALKLSYAGRGLWASGDRFSVGLGLPQAVHNGVAQVALPIAMSQGGASFDTIDVSLVPDARQMDFSLSYGVPLSPRSDIVMSASHSINDGNIAGRTNTVAAVGFNFRF